MASISIPFSKFSVTQLKAMLCGAYPHIKSSHAFEAISSGLNFNTYSALLVTAEQASSSTVLHRELNLSKLIERLVQFGYPQIQGTAISQIVACLHAVTSEVKVTRNETEFPIEQQRRAATDLPSRLQALGLLPSQIAEIEIFLKGPPGIILVGGLPNSGKSTTAQVICNVATKLGVSSEYVGDIRDERAGSYAFAYASQKLQNGSKGVLIASMHTAGALEMLVRLESTNFNINLAEFHKLGLLNLLLINQTMVPTICSHCSPLVNRAENQKWKNAVNSLAVRFKLDTSQMFLHKEDGCPFCTKGFDGMTSVAEVIHVRRHLMQCYIDKGLDAAIDYWRSSSDGKLESAQMTGKSLSHHALHLALKGRIGVQTLDSRFHWFDEVLEER